MRRRWGLLFITLILAMIALTACGGDKDKQKDKAEDGDIVLNFVHWLDEDNGKWEPIIKKYEEENPGIKIESMPLVDNMDSIDYYKQLDLMASAGEKIDLMLFSNVNDLVKRVNSGIVEPIDEYLDDEGIEMDDVYNDSYGTIEDKYYGLPMKNVTNLVMMNKDHLDEAGLEIPTEWTWDDYREYAKKLTTDDHYGSYLHVWHNLHSAVKLVGKPEETLILKEDGSSNADDPMLKESLELRYQLEQEDKSSVPFNEIFSQQLDYRQQFFTQEASMIPIRSFMITEWGQFEPDFDIVWAPWPQNEPGDNYSDMSGDMLSLAAKSDHKQEAYDFMRWLTTEGIVEQGIWTPSWKEADFDVVLEELISATSNPEAVDLESLKHSLESVQTPEKYAPASYISEVDTEFDAEVEMYLLGEQDIDTTMDNIQKKVQAVIDENK